MANKVGLTDAKIAGLKAPAAGQIELADGIVPGLRLRMGASGIKTYILRKRVQGKWLNVTIGRHGPSFTLAHARKKARDLLVDVEQGKSIARRSCPSMWCKFGCGQRAAFSGGLGCNL
ncbi:Arm DNA-binding domain-containing protein [Blastomonas sp.]|uniref:Arm DNA-binding domain-containing protein n=1 Tax=Blastomonas sp. TaxID=1909299 RepID=UPI00406A8D5F